MDKNISSETSVRWKSGDFIEVGQDIPQHNYDLPWIPYEDYMQAQLVEAKPGEIGRIIVRFPPEGCENNELHIHPISDRIITIIDGCGEFICLRSHSKKLSRYELKPGNKVWMPRGVLHTFLAGGNGLLVESIHNPFIPFNDTTCLIYPKERRYHV